MKEYINPEDIFNSIEIKSCTKLSFEYKDIKKDVFIDKYKGANIVQGCENFVKVIKKLEPYFVEFDKDGTMKNKKYLLDCVIESINRRLVIIIIHDESIFSTNDSI